MKIPYFFGYGSLVNGQTHAYPGMKPAKVEGWRRLWQPSPERPVAFLSVVPAPDHWTWGVIAQVPGSDWVALDKRESEYRRRPLVPHTILHDADPAEVHIYAIDDPVAPNPEQPILLSYLDVVIQGFLREHGAKGAEHFFETTDGWNVPVLNDRDNPRYPRHQKLDKRETDIVDAGLRNLSAVVD